MPHCESISPRIPAIWLQGETAPLNDLDEADQELDDPEEDSGDVAREPDQL